MNQGLGEPGTSFLMEENNQHFAEKQIGQAINVGKVEPAGKMFSHQLSFLIDFS